MAWWMMMMLMLAAPPEHWQPVDQGVGDLDELSTSLRAVRTGLRSDGEQTSLYVVPTMRDGRVERVYYRIGPGFVARLHRPDYLVPISRDRVARNVQPAVDGRFIEVIPANTVFDLRPRYPEPAVSAGGWVDPRVQHRVDGRIEGRIDGRVEGRLE